MEYIFLVLIIAIDQICKHIIVSNFFLGESIPVVDGIFHITYVLNPGAAFGIMQNMGIVFIVAAVLLVLAVFYFRHWLRKQCFFLRLGVISVLAGAIGNLIDRIQTGLVVDFFDFRIWPVFNIADISICVGVVAIIYALMFRKEVDDNA